MRLMRECYLVIVYSSGCGFESQSTLSRQCGSDYLQGYVSLEPHYLDK